MACWVDSPYRVETLGVVSYEAPVDNFGSETIYQLTDAWWRPAASLSFRANAIWQVCQLDGELNRQHAGAQPPGTSKDTGGPPPTDNQSTDGWMRDSFP